MGDCKLLCVAACALALGTTVYGGEARPEARGGAAETDDNDHTFLGVSALRDRPDSDGALSLLRYVPPRAKNLAFSTEGITLSEAQRALLAEALTAVASNFQARNEADVRVTQMALAVAMQLLPKSQSPKMADYLLRRGRLPVKVEGLEDRALVTSKLWNAGFGLERYAETADDASLALCVLDIARRFEREPSPSASAYDALGLPPAAGRWKGVTEVSEIEPDAEVAPPEVRGVAAPPMPEPFHFKARSASVALFGTDPEPRTVSVDVSDWQSLPPRQRRQSPQFSFDSKAAEAVVRSRHPEWRATGCMLSYVTAAETPAPSEALAAVLLADAVAEGVAIDSRFALAGGLADDGSILAADDLHRELAFREAPGPAIVAIPAENVTEFADLAAEGSLDALLARQYLAFESPDELLEIARADRTSDWEKAIRKFGEIQALAANLRAREIVANPFARARLREIVKVAPGHLSAKHLLLVSVGQQPDGLSMGGSRDRLSRLREAMRLLVASVSGPGTVDAENRIAERLFELRRLRPLLHATTRDAADRLAETIESARTAVRSGNAKAIARLGEAFGDGDAVPSLAAVPAAD